MGISVFSKNRQVSCFSGLLHDLYEAGTRPEHWTATVGAIARSFGCTKGLLFTPYVAPQHGGLVFPFGIDESALQLWGSTYIEQDIWSRALVERGPLRAGEVLLDEQLVPFEELLASRFYRDFLSKIGIGRVCAGLVFGNEPGLMATSLAVFRAIDEPPFNQVDRQWMELLVGHVSRSLGIMQRLDTARLQRTSLLESFDRLAFGVVLLDAGMRVMHMNGAARSAIERRDGLAIDSSGQLESAIAQNRGMRLSQWLTSLREAPAARQIHFLDGCIVPRSNGGAHYVVQCSALAAGEWNVTGSEVRYVAFITDPAALRLPDEERLMKLYSLTSAQARVTLALARGASYKEAARRLSISEETVRSHIKAIYPKTRVNRQADLVRLVLSLGQSSI